MRAVSRPGAFLTLEVPMSVDDNLALARDGDGRSWRIAREAAPPRKQGLGLFYACFHDADASR